jgi:hypothetical protein
MVALKIKVCKICEAEFTPRTGLQRVCRLECSLELDKQKKLEKGRKEFNAETKRRRENLKTNTERADEAQAAFNRYIRERDLARGLPCVSCGTLTPTQWHAGHYRTVKAAKQLRYNCWNVQRQCSQCNAHDSGNVVEYRLNLIRRIGLHRVEALEQDHRLAKYPMEYLIRLKKIFNKRANRLVKRRESSYEM